MDELSEFVGAPFGPKTATIILPPNPWVWAAIIAPALAGIGLVLFGWTRCGLDQESRVVAVEKPGFFGVRRQEYSLAAVDRFAIRQRWDPTSFEYEYGELRNITELRPCETSLVLAIILKDGREVTLLKRMFGGRRGLDFVRTLEKFRNDRPDAVVGGSSVALGKRCVLCGEECAAGPKYKDERGRYYHPACYERIVGKVRRQ